MINFKAKLKKIKTNLKNFIIKTKDVIKENTFVLCYIGGAVLNGIVLRGLTIGKAYSIAPFFADLFISLIFASFYFLIKKKRKNLYLYTMTIISTVICIANIVYYHYYESFISITFISFALTNYDTGDANVVGNLLQPEFFVLLWYPLFMIIMGHVLKKKEHQPKIVSQKKSAIVLLKWALVSLFILVLNLNFVDYGRFYTQWNREYTVSKFGIYLYQVNDLVKSVEPEIASLFGSDKANKEIADYFKATPDEQNHQNKYTNLFAGKNVIAIHAESMQTAALEQKFNGLDVTPNLNKLASTGLYFSNFYSQVSFGTSSDTEFTLATSLLPINNGTVFINYADREYNSAYKLLQDMGYYTFSMHANTGDFWNRNIMHQKLGYQKFYEKSSYIIPEEEKIGFGLSDKSFFMQSADYIEQIAKQHENFYGTLITLSNHTPFEDLEDYGEFDVSMRVDGQKYQYMENTKLGNYFKSVHYADQQIGLFIDELDKRGLLENTIIIIYGDHDARIEKKEWEKLYNYNYQNNGIIDKEDPNYIDIDYYWYELNRNVPLIIWSKDETFQKEYATEVTTVMGMYDVMPTLGNMLGFYNKYALGNDIFEVKDNLVVFPNGNFLTNYVYYRDTKEEYKLLKDIPLDIDYIEKNKEDAKKRLQISNDIVIYDYFKKDLSKELYEVEK